MKILIDKETVELALEYLQDNQHLIADNERHVYVMEYNAFIERFEKAIEQLTEQEPIAFINVEERKLEWAKYIAWDTPTVVNLPKIPLYTQPQEAAQEYKRGYADAMNWKVQNHLEHLPAKGEKE